MQVCKKVRESIHGGEFGANGSGKSEGQGATTVEALAHSTKRSKSFLAAQAISAYVEREDWQISEIEKAVKEADTRDFASEAEVDAVISKWTE